MILDAEERIAGLVADNAKRARLSAVCIYASRMKLLLFDGQDASKPLYVAQVGTFPELDREDRFLRALHSALPELVADSLGCFPWQRDEWLQVQRGLPGVPWFGLAHRLRSVAEWMDLRERAIDALRTFEVAVRRHQEWTCVLAPGRELMREGSRSEGLGVRQSSRLRAEVERLSGVLDEIGEIRASWQHGDFCLNNLLVSRHTVSVIDLAEFGETSMPLQDEIGLALSLYMLAPEKARGVTLRDHLNACLGEAGALAREEYLHGFLLHYLIRRINRSHRQVTRAAMAARLLAAAEALCAAPAQFLDDGQFLRHDSPLPACDSLPVEIV